MKDLNIPLPEVEAPGMPASMSYRWCRCLHAALRPLCSFKREDGHYAVQFLVATRPGHSIHIEKHWDDASAWDYGDLGEDVCCIMQLCLPQNAQDYEFKYQDFLDEAAAAKAKFAKMIKHLETEARPQIPPEWIGKALDALQSK